MTTRDDLHSAELWNRLTTTGDLGGLDLPQVNGRLDLAGLQAPAAPAPVVLGSLRWSGLDLSRARLPSLRFHDFTIEDCVLDGADCQDWRLWTTRVERTSFRGTNLRKSALSGIEDGRRNAFRTVDFERADLRSTAHVSADFVGCRFVDCKLAKVDFQGDVFEDCVFAGTLDEVLFYARAFRGEAYPANQMRGVDLRRARLRHVEFRGLDMSDVAWPEDDDHVVVKDYPAVLDRVLAGLAGRSEPWARKMATILTSQRKWAGPAQQVGVISKLDLREVGGEDAVGEFVRLAGAGG